jgi:hypothetical protein
LTEYQQSLKNHIVEEVLAALKRKNGDEKNKKNGKRFSSGSL